MAGNAVTVVVKAKDEASPALAAVEAKGSRLGGIFEGVGKAAAIGVAGIGVAAVGAATGLFKLGSSFDDAFDKIAIGTGATGEALEGLQGDFKAVFSSIPTDMGSASEAIAGLNTRMGLSGDSLQTMSKAMLEMTRITGGDLTRNIEGISRLMGDWGIDPALEDSVTTLDSLFVASQKTGIGVDKLSEQMVQFGAPLRQLGFDFNTSAALLAKFEKEGVNAELVMGSLRIALGKMARDGEPAEETLNRTVDAIKNAGSTSEANALALELFGARAGPDMAAAIREGRFAVDDLVSAMRNADGAIMETAENTADFGERWTVFKNKLLVALEPMASKVLEWATVLMEKALPAVDQISVAIGKAAEVIKTFANYIKFAAEDGDVLNDFLADMPEPLKAITLEIGKLVVVIKEDIIPALQELGARAQEEFRKFQTYYETDIKPAMDNIAAAVEWVVGKFQEYWPQIEQVVKPVMENVRIVVETVVLIVKETLQIIIDLLGGDFSGAWENTKQLISGVTEKWIEFVRNSVDILKGLVGLFKEVGKDLIGGIKDGAIDFWDNTLKPWLEDLPGNILSALGDLGSLLYDAGVDLVQGLIDGIESMIDKIPNPLDKIPGAGAIGGAFGKISSTLDGGVAGASQYMTTIGDKQYPVRFSGDDAYIQTSTGQWLREGNLTLNRMDSPLVPHSIQDLVDRGFIQVVVNANVPMDVIHKEVIFEDARAY